MDLSPAEFELAPDLIYLNHAAVSPWPRRTRDAVCAFAERSHRRGAADYGPWLETEARLRQRLARLINASAPEDVALTKNTSEALSMIGRGLYWRPGDNVVSIAQEFPSNRIVWESLAPLGVELRLLDLYGCADPEGGLLGLCNSGTRVLSVSSVQYARGLKLDLERIGTACRRRGILFCVDAIQSLGVVPFDVQTCQADFVVADGHKWMLGPEGVALFWSRPEARDRLSLHEFGWHMVEHPGDFERRDWRPSRDARRFECGSPNMLGIHALESSLSLVEELGIEPIHSEVLALCNRLVEAIERNGFTLLSPRDESRRGGIVTFALPGIGSEWVHKALMARGILCACRGGGIRFSPHFYDTPERCDHAVQITCDIRSALD